jgi:SAM-dependent methyltransferase
MPVHSVVLMRSQEEARNIERGDINLGFCGTCGFIGNFTFDVNLINYSSEYESTQAYSPTFNIFHHQLATHFIDRYDLHGKNIIEIGCGQGEFLQLLCRLGNNHGLGFDPAYRRDTEGMLEQGNVRFVSDYYSEKYADTPADFIASKMTLEHIFETRYFVSQLRRAFDHNSNAIVFVQVPDATRILGECAFWDIHYEHCCYFTPASLANVFQMSGFELIDVRNAYFDTYLIIEAKPISASRGFEQSRKNDLKEVRNLVEHFKKYYAEITTRWNDKLKTLHSAGQRTVIWGSSSKATAFLSTLGIEDEIEYVVDINPHRQGTFMPGTGQRIVSPNFLREYQPDNVIVINPIYCEEVQKTLDTLEVKAHLAIPQDEN